MNPQFWWYVARSTGIVAWACAVGSVLWGLALSSRTLGRRPRAPWLLDLHRFLGALTIAFVALHLVALVADNYVHFSLADLFVPFASDWKAGAVAWGIVALYPLLAVEITSLFMRRIPKRVWRAVHLSSYAVAVTATVHLFTAGTDNTNPVLRGAAAGAAAAILFGTVYRLLAPQRPAQPRVAAVPREPAVPPRAA
jgi:DMSO/TMAO reductase YedYZ heme-binding membrane subunit